LPLERWGEAVARSFLVSTLVAANLFGACLASAADAPPPDDAGSRLQATVDPIIEAFLKESGAPGAGLVIVHRGKVVVLKGYGESDRETHEPSTAETVWPIASITKVLTAIAVMQQVEQGKMKLDADIGIYLKRLKVPEGFDRPITLADTLRHTSGLDELPGRLLEHSPGAMPLDEFLAGKLVRYRAPGDYTSYSSYGMALAGVALEDVSGELYATYLEQHLFSPLGLESTRIMLRDDDAAGVATPYALDDAAATKISYEWYATPPTSSGAMSLTDMAKLMIELTSDTPRIVSRATLDLMMTQQATLNPQVPGWGYGFQLDEANGQRIAEHGGDIGGFAALMSIVPGQQLGIFTVNHGEGSSLRFAIRKAVLDLLFSVPPRIPPRTAVIDLSPFVGVYRASFQCHTCKEPSPVPEFEVTSDLQGGLSLWGSIWYPLGDDVFENSVDRRRVAFIREAEGRVIALTGGSWRVGERVR
jgi:CubicO group peptidase (beta-lactamase class C family)